MASQKPEIFYGTIRDNLLFGKINNKINEYKIQNALEIAKCNDFVSLLKYGINTQITQGGE